MKKFSLLFLSLFIIGLISTPALADITSAGNGNWNAGGTWVGGNVPSVTDNVIILSGHNVTVSATGATCALLTINAGGQCTIGGAFTLPGTSWSLDPTSTVDYTVAPSSFVYTPYGNLQYDGANYGLTGNLVVNGNLTVTANALRGIATASGSWTHHVVGNVILSGAGRLTGVNMSSTSASSCTWNIDGNVTLTGTARIQVYESAGPFSGTSTFNINGYLSIGTGTQLMYKSSSPTTGNYEVGTINLKGDLVQNGPIGINSVTSGTVKGLIINMIGTSNQNWSGSGAFSVSASTITFNVNNSAGVTLTATAPRTFNTNTILNLQAGNLNTDVTNLLTISTGTLTGGSASSFVSGPMAYLYAIAATTSKTYPIGKGGIYRPLILSLTQSATTPSTYTAEMFNSAPAANILPVTLDKVSSVRYYTISESVGGSAFTAGSLLLNYDTNDGVTASAQLRIAQGPSAGRGDWVDLGGTGTASPTGTITSTNSFTDLTTNTIFALAESAGGTNPLPVELSTFTANNNGRTIQLNWETKTEVKLNKFEIDRALVSTNDASVTWASVGTLQASGTSNSPKKYSYTEKNLQTGKYQYRLKMIDNDGSYKFSNIVETDITSPKNFELSQNYPNPFNPSTRINYNLPFDSRVTLEVYNIIGERMGQIVNEEQSAGYYTVNFSSSNLNKSITSGVYIYKINAVDKSTGNVFTSIKKMMLLK